MTDTVEVVREHSKTEREVWVLEVFNFPIVCLRSYAHQERETTRHKWRNQSSYYRLGYERVVYDKRLGYEPEIPADVVAEGMTKLASSLTFKRWKP